MSHLLRRSSKKAGMKPGKVVFVGEQKIDRPVITIIDYNETELRELRVDTVEECFPFRDSPTITWINVTGLHDTSIIERLGEHFEVHPLVLEDIAHTGQRPKAEETPHYLFVVLKMLSISKENDSDFNSEQLSLLIGNNAVISFQEREGDAFDGVRDRLRKTIPRVRFMHTDYLAYTLIDAVVDNYFPILENMAEAMEELEDIIFDSPNPEHLQEIQSLKRELILMRKRVWPLREVVSLLERSESELIHDQTRVYLRDLYEHVIQVNDTVESFRDMVSGLLDIYLSSVSNKMNEVMKVLTIIATIFIPLGFLAGVYGMNFNSDASPFNMPELGFEYGYIGFWIVALLIGGGLFWSFKKRQWL